MLQTSPEAGRRTAPSRRPPPPDLCRRHLNPDFLLAGLHQREDALAALEAAFVGACEAAAQCHAAPQVRMEDQSTWDPGTARRYLDAAARLEVAYGPDMRRLLREIAQLRRLLSLPIVDDSRRLAGIGGG